MWWSKQHLLFSNEFPISRGLEFYKKKKKTHDDSRIKIKSGYKLSVGKNVRLQAVTSAKWYGYWSPAFTATCDGRHGREILSSSRNQIDHLTEHWFHFRTTILSVNPSSILHLLPLPVHHVSEVKWLQLWSCSRTSLRSSRYSPFLLNFFLFQPISVS